MIERLLKRGETSGRSDDNMEVILKRLETHETITSPVIDYYRQRNLLKTVSTI